jgi:hypothetical protein
VDLAWVDPDRPKIASGSTKQRTASFQDAAPMGWITQQAVSRAARSSFSRAIGPGAGTAGRIRTASPPPLEDLAGLDRRREPASSAVCARSRRSEPASARLMRGNRSSPEARTSQANAVASSCAAPLVGAAPSATTVPTGCM